MVVLRCFNEVLYPRLEKRGYSEKKVQENVECEIMCVVAEDARESYREEVSVSPAPDDIDPFLLSLPISFFLTTCCVGLLRVVSLCRSELHSSGVLYCVAVCFVSFCGLQDVLLLSFQGFGIALPCSFCCILRLVLLCRATLLKDGKASEL